MSSYRMVPLESISIWLCTAMTSSFNRCSAGWYVEAWALGKKQLLKRVCGAVRLSVKSVFGIEGSRGADFDMEGCAVVGASDVAAATEVQAPSSCFTLGVVGLTWYAIAAAVAAPLNASNASKVDVTAFIVPTRFSLGLCVFVMGFKAVMMILADVFSGPIASALEFNTVSRPALKTSTPAKGCCAPCYQHKEGEVWLVFEKSCQDKLIMGLCTLMMLSSMAFDSSNIHPYSCQGSLSSPSKLRENNIEPLLNSLVHQ